MLSTLTSHLIIELATIAFVILILLNKTEGYFSVELDKCFQHGRMTAKISFPK